MTQDLMELANSWPNVSPFIHKKKHTSCLTLDDVYDRMDQNS